MKRLIPLYFPETVPDVQNIAGLLYFFKAVSYYLPLEPSTAPPADSTIQVLQDLCSGYAPAPLGNDLKRFKHLIRELEKYRPEDISRLFSFSKSGITAEQIRDREESSASTLLSALHKDKDNKVSEQSLERLWQARLVLKLAEMLDKRETEIRHGLATLSGIERNLYDTLRGSGKTGAEDPAQLSGLDTFSAAEGHGKPLNGLSVSQADLLMPLRVKAWGDLFLVDNKKTTPCVLVTARPDAAAIILDSCENNSRQSQKLFSLAIPEPPILGIDVQTDHEYLTKRLELQATADDILTGFDHFLLETALQTLAQTDSITISESLEKGVDGWNETVSRMFPDSTESSKRLNFYCFPISTENIFLRLLSREKLALSGKTDYPTTILAVLNS
jgi:hypothetical protein